MGHTALVDPLTLEVNGRHYEQFVEALVDAFPSYPDLGALTRYRLDLNLAVVAGADAPLDQVALRLVETQKAKGYFLRLIDAARASRPGNPKLAFFAEQFRLALETPARPELQRIVNETSSFLDIAEWRERLGEIEGRVCRVEVVTNRGTMYGTGFLVGPELVLTNHHVVEAVLAGENNQTTASGATARRSDVSLRFDYRQIGDGVVNPGTVARVAEILDSSPISPVDLKPLPKPGLPDPDHLDYALLRVEFSPGVAFGASPIGERPEQSAPARGAIPVPITDWPFDRDSPLFIVQHPAAAPMKLALGEKAVIGPNANRTRVTYRTNTLGGSSGAPCFNQHLELVALHHAGDPNFAPLHHAQFNEGIPIAMIRDRLIGRGKAAGMTMAAAAGV